MVSSGQFVNNFVEIVFLLFYYHFAIKLILKKEGREPKEANKA